MYRPRLSENTPTPMQGNKWWYSSGNIYWPNYGLPNCTCYCYGRVAEIANQFKWCPAGDGKEWYDKFLNHIAQTGEYSVGYWPKLGGVMCYTPECIDPDDPQDPFYTEGGHVSIVEEVIPDGQGGVEACVTSNSAYNGSYFWTERVHVLDDFRSSWMFPPTRHYIYQGCVYVTPDNPIDYFAKGNDDPIWMYLRYRKN